MLFKILTEPITSTGIDPTKPELPVFTVPVSPTSVRQEGLTNCPLHAVLAAMAHVCPAQIMRMIEERPQSLRTWLFGRPIPHTGFSSTKMLTVRFQNAPIEISPVLYFDSHNQPRFGRSTDGAGWVAYIEKAYVIHRGHFQYENLNLLGAVNAIPVERIMEDLVFEFNALELRPADGEVKPRFLADLEPINTEPPSDATDMFDTATSEFLSSSAVAQRARKMVKRATKRATVATTPSHQSIHTQLGLHGEHTYAVISETTGKVNLFDPMDGKPLRLTYKEFIGAFQDIYQARAHSACS